MEIIIRNKSLDLYQNTNVSIDFDIQVNQDVSKRYVSFTNTFKIPSTDENKEIISSEINNEGKILNVQVKFDGGFNFNATLYVDRESIDVVGEEYSIRLVSSLSEMLKQIGSDGLEKLFDTGDDDFTFLFNDDPRIGAPPVTPNNWFFITASNRNGMQYDDVNNFPIYANRFIEADNSNLFVTISIYNLLRVTFNKYNIQYSFTDTTEILDGVSIDDLYIFIPTQFVSTVNRYMELLVNDDYTITTVNNYLNQIDESNNGMVTARCDTIYNTTVETQPNFELKFFFSDGCPDSPIVHGGTASIYLRLYMDDVQYKDILIKEFSASEIGSFISINMSETFRMDFLATSQLQFGYRVVFNNMEVEYDSSQGCDGTMVTTLLNGDYSVVNNETQGFLGWGFETVNSLMVEFDTYKNLSAVSLIEGNHSILETVDMYETIKRKNISLSGIINDILKRFNAGFYLDNNGNVNISTFNNRYSNDFITLVSSDNGYVKLYTNNSLGVFYYKNKVDERDSKYLIKQDDDTYVKGDVINQDFGGSKNETITLISSYVERNLYKEDVKVLDSGEEELLKTVINNITYKREHWGIPYNETLANNELPILIGNISLQSTNYINNNILLPCVEYITLPTSGTNPIVSYRRNAMVDNNNFALNGNDLNLYIPYREDYLLLGDENGELDETSIISENFKPITHPLHNPIEIEAVLDTEDINNILNGHVIYLIDDNGLGAKYYPLRIEGIMAEQEKSIIKIKMIKE